MNTTNYRIPSGGLAYGRPSAAVALPFVGVAIFTFFLVSARWAFFTEVGIAIALLGLALRPQGLIFPAPAKWALAFVLWALATSFFSVAPESAHLALIERGKSLLIFLVVINALRTPRQLRFYVLLVVCAFMIYPARGTLINYVTGNTVFGRAIWNQMYANPNDLGAMTLLTAGLALTLVTVSTEQRRIRWALGLCVPVMLTIVLLTQSRGVFIGLIISFGPALLGLLRRRPSRAVLLLVALLFGAALVPSSVWQRLAGISKLTSTQSAATADPEGSAAQRMEIAGVAWRIFTDHPVGGVGIGCYSVANALYAPQLGPRDAHNTYLTLAAELGLPGLLLWLGMVASVLLYVKRRRRDPAAADAPIHVAWLGRAVVGFLIAGFFGSYSGITMFYLILGALWAMANSLPVAPGVPARRPWLQRVQQ